MLRVLIVDDSNDKVVNIIKVVRTQTAQVHVDVVTDVISAQKNLTEIKYDLLILDVNLPIRYGEPTSTESGKNLLSEINRKKAIKSPYYIISITQYADECKDISTVWRTISYSPENVDWHEPLLSLLSHISKCGIPNPDLDILKPTLFLEGRTDEKIFRAAIEQFNPPLLDQICIKSDKSAGASWVARQVIAWSHSLYRDQSETYIKAIGLLDGDFAGNMAQNEINRVIKSDSAESKTFRVLKLSASYAKHIIPIKKKGLNLPVTLEEMFTYADWKVAEKNNWLETRQNAEALLMDPTKWNKYDTSLKDYIHSLGLTEQENLFVNSVKEEFKGAFADYVCSQSAEGRTASLTCFEKLVSDIAQYLVNS